MVHIPTFSSCPEILIVAPTRSVLKEILRACQIAGLESRTRKILDFTDIYIFPGLSLLGPVVGAAAATLAVEPFLHSGVKQLALIGACGGLTSGNAPREIGDIVSPRRALSEEGTSPLYGAPREFDIQPSTIQTQLEKRISEEMSLEAVSGISSVVVWTTDAPWRETPDKIRDFTARGANVVDMEFSALAWLTQHYSCQLACLFVVSDLVSEEHERGFHSQIFRERLSLLCRKTVELLTYQ